MSLNENIRIVTNRKSAEKHFRRIKKYIPETGIVRILKLTEKQYDNYRIFSRREK